jgi:flagellar protein FlaG
MQYHNAKESTMEVLNAVKQTMTTLQQGSAANSDTKRVAQVAQQNEQQSQKQDKQQNVDDLKKQISQMTSELNQQMAMMNTSIQFGFNDKTDSMYVTVTDSKDGKVIRKIPTDEMMTLQEAMRDAIGVIFDKKG